MPKSAANPVGELPSHIASLTEGSDLITTCGRQIRVWELTASVAHPDFSTWAKAFRQHYCDDENIDALREELSRKEYLETLVFPHAKQKPGPSIRSGDFAELLVGDFFQFTRRFWIPRFKYQDKASPNESVKGSDVIGFYQLQPGVASALDQLIVCEVKAQLTGNKYKDRLKTAVKDSSKDISKLRLATSLNAIKRRASVGNLTDKVGMISRFQRKTDSKFILKSAAVAILTNEVYDATSISSIDCSDHANAGELELIVMRGANLMELVHKLYEVAANEA